MMLSTVQAGLLERKTRASGWPSYAAALGLALVVLVLWLGWAYPVYGIEPRPTIGTVPSVEPVRAPPAQDESGEWRRLIVSQALTLLVGFGAAWMGVRATLRATREAAERSLEATRISKNEDAQEELRLGKRGLLREIALNNTVLQTETVLFRRIQLQYARLKRYAEITSPPEYLDQLLGEAELYIQKYNSLVVLLSGAAPELVEQIVAELGRMREAGIDVLERLKTAVNDGPAVS